MSFKTSSPIYRSVTGYHLHEQMRSQIEQICFLARVNWPVKLVWIDYGGVDEAVENPQPPSLWSSTDTLELPLLVKSVNSSHPGWCTAGQLQGKLLKVMINLFACAWPHQPHLHSKLWTLQGQVLCPSIVCNSYVLLFATCNFICPFFFFSCKQWEIFAISTNCTCCKYIPSTQFF